MAWQRGSGRRGGRRGARSGGLSKRRPKEWQSAELLGGSDLILPGECVGYPLILPDEFDAEYSDSTLVRVRGSYLVTPGLPLIDGLFVSPGAIGIIEVEGVDANAIVPNLWCPVTDADASWAWHNYYIASTARAGTGVAGGVGGYNPVNGEIDTSAMRRLEAGDSSLWLVIEHDAGADQQVDFWFGVRFIIAEK